MAKITDLNIVELPDGGEYGFRDDSAIASISKNGNVFTITYRNGSSTIVDDPYYDSIYPTEVQTGDLVVTGASRFLYTINGNIASADKVNHDLVIQLNSGTAEGTNKFTFNGSSAKTVDITPENIGAATSGHLHDDRYLKLSGGTMTGPVTFVGNQSSAWNNKGILFTNGSRIGEGSSVFGIYSFGNIAIRPNASAAVGTEGINITADGLYPTNNNSESLGLSTNIWKTVYAETFHGVATSANKLNTDAGSATNPVYFSNGIPVACTYSLNKTVPSDAVFTDTTYGIGNSGESLTLTAGGTGTSVSVSTLLSNLPVWSAVPTDNTYFIRRDTNNTASFGQLKFSTIWSYIHGKADLVYSPLGHTHNYAGSSTPGGAATSADKLNTDAGSSFTPVYFNNGIPVACTSIDLPEIIADSSEITELQVGNLVVTGTSRFVGTINGTIQNSISDASGNIIMDTYASSMTIHDHTITLKNKNNNTLSMVTVPDSDENVAQTEVSTDAAYEVLLSGTADTTTRTEGANKSAGLTFNPSMGSLTVKKSVYSKGLYLKDAQATPTTANQFGFYQWGTVVQFTYRDGNNTFLGDAFEINVTNGKSIWNKDATYKASLYPDATNTYYIGSSTKAWKAIYATNFYGNLTGNATNAYGLIETTTEGVDPTPVDEGGLLNPVYFSNGVPVESGGQSIPFVVGTGSTAGAWLGTIEGLTSYYDGLLILYKPSVKGANTTTLNLNSLGAKTIYINNTTKLTTHFPANQPILLVYSSSQNSGCFMCIDDYWTNSDTKVTQSSTTTENWRKVILSYQDSATPGSATTSQTNVVYATPYFEFQPSTGNARIEGTVTLTSGTIAENDPYAVTGHAVWSAINALPEPMIFKGTLGTGGTITTLPTASLANEGWTYKVITAGTYASKTAKVGDMFCCATLDDGSTYTWIYVPSGDDVEDTWREIKVNGTQVLASGITTGAVDFVAGNATTVSFNSTGSKISYSHADTSSQASSSNSGRTYIQSITLDTYGHVTGLSTATETVVDTNYYHKTGSWNGLTYTAAKVGSPEDLAFTIPVGTTATTVAVGNHNHDSVYRRLDDPNYYSIYATEIQAGDLSVTGSARFLNTINGNISGNAATATNATNDSAGNPIASTYLPLSGGTMTGGITLPGDSSNAYNTKGIVFSDGAKISVNTSSYHVLGIYSAGNIVIRPSSGSASSGDGVEISTTGLYPTNNNTENLGTSDHKWNTVYATTFNGTATTASKLGTNAGSATNPVYFSGGIPVACTYNLEKSVPSDAIFTDQNVTQTATTTSANYEILFSSTADNTTRTEGARKNSNLVFNPSTGTLSTTVVTSGTITADTGSITSATLGNLIVNGNASFVNTISGDISGNAATATKATQDGDGNTISSTYLKLSGGAMTGTVSWDSTSLPNKPASVNAVVIDAFADGGEMGWRALGSNAFTSTAYLPLAGGTMTGALHVSNSAPLIFDYTSGAETAMFTLKNSANYGIRYKEGTPDTLKISASGNANTDAGADLCINGNGDGTVTIRGNTIVHAGNIGSGDANGQIKLAGVNVNVTGLGSAAYTDSSAYSPSGHTHSTSIASSTRTNQLTLAYGGKYSVTSGGTSFVFTMPSDTNVDTKVTQTVTTTNATYELLFSESADNTTHTETSRKNSNLTFNPSTGTLSTTLVSATDVTSSSATFTELYSGNIVASGVLRVTGKVYADGFVGSIAEGTGFTSTQVTTALGYTPYNSTNPAGYTSNTGTVTKVSTGVGLTGGDVTTTGTIKAKLKSETASTLESASMGSTSSRQYAVGVDKSGYLSVNVPWTDHYAWGDITGKPTTISGYGITDAKIANGVITLGGATITPLTSHQTVTDNNPTLAWSTKSTVATIGNTAIHVTMPSNPNTDENVKQVASTTTSWRKVALSAQYDASAGTAVTETTSYVCVTPNIEVQPSTGTLRSAGNITATVFGVASSTGTSGGISLYSGDSYVDTYGIAFRKTSNKEVHGYVTSDWATYFTMSDTDNRGWIFRRNKTNGNIASISTNGNMVLNGNITIGGNMNNSSGCRIEFDANLQVTNFVFV